MCKQGFEEVFKVDKELINNIQKNICDGGYDGKEWKVEMKKQFEVEIEITQRTDIANGVVSKIRWISERTFAWLDKCRRLSKNYETCLLLTPLKNYDPFLGLFFCGCGGL
jgi:transposase